MAIETLRKELLSLSEDELTRLISVLSRDSATLSLFRLSPEDRFRLVWGVVRLPLSRVKGLGTLGAETIGRLRRLRDKGLNTFSRTAAVLIEDSINRLSVYNLDYSPLPNGPMVVFVANVGAQVPTPRPTLGYHLRQRRALLPPFGVYYVASFLSLLGVETRVFNLALGEQEYRELEETITTFIERIWFVSFASNFLGERELDAVFYLSDLLNQFQDDRLNPRLVGGGMGVYFSRELYLRYTPMEIVIGRYGELSFGDMVYSSDYRGPRDDRDNVTLFGNIPNLHIAVCRKSREMDIHSTRTQPLSRGERRVLANAFNFRMVPYSEKYWSTGLAIAICSPDDLNIPVQLAYSEMRNSTQSPGDYTIFGSLLERSESSASSWIPIHSVEFPLHPSNYLYKPKAAKVMTTFGNCPRRCKFCQLSQFDEHIFFLSASETINLFNRLLKAHPDVHLILIDDDDFLLRGRYCLDLVEHLKMNALTSGKVFYIETVPMGVTPSILRALYEVGFRAILMGIESPVEKIARDCGKLSSRDSFEQFITAPYVAHDAGYFTRVTTIPFYPTVAENDLPEIVRRLVNYIEYGIAVSVFPLVQALPGAEIVTSKRHDFVTSHYVFPESALSVELPEYVLPDDPIVRALAFQSIRATAAQLGTMLRQHGIVGDYPSSIGVLAFFRSIVESLFHMRARSTSDETLNDLRNQIDATADKLVYKHFIQRDVQQAVYDLNAGNRIAGNRIARWLDDSNVGFALAGLRMLLDFGTVDEVIGAAKLTKHLAQLGVVDRLLNESLRYCLGRRLTHEQRRELEAIANQLDVLC